MYTVYIENENKTAAVVTTDFKLENIQGRPPDDAGTYYCTACPRTLKMLTRKLRHSTPTFCILLTGFFENIYTIKRRVQFFGKNHYSSCYWIKQITSHMTVVRALNLYAIISIGTISLLQ